MADTNLLANAGPISSVSNVTTENVMEVVKALPAEDMAKVKTIADCINFEDSAAITQYGTAAQQKISDFSNQVLSEVRAKDSGYIGDMLFQLSDSVKAVDTDSLIKVINSPKVKSFFNNIKSQFNKFMSGFERLDVQINKISAQLDSSMLTLVKDITMLDMLFDNNLDFIKELDYYIVAAAYKLHQLRTETIPALKEAAEKSGDQLQLQAYNDMQANAEGLDKKLGDLRLSRMIAIQSAPQIRLIQQNDKVLADKIQTSILTTIPLWKSQIVIAISLYRQKSSLEMQKKVTQTTNDLLLKNSEMLKLNTIETAAEAERGIVELETLKTVNANLIATIDETIRIQEEGKAKRRAAETELAAIEQQLKDKFLNRA